jgi:hypothetical protein
MIDDAFELDAIRAVSPLRGEPDPGRRAAAQAELMRLVSAQGADMRQTRRSLRTPRARRFPVPAWSLGALATIAAAVVASVSLVGHGGAVQPQSAAAGILDRAAQAPAMVSPMHLGPGQYWYVEDVLAGPRAQNMHACGNACYEIRVVRWWVGANRYVSHQYVIERSAKPTAVTALPPNAPLKAARYSPRWSGVGGGYDQILHYSQMLTMPTDVGSLKDLTSHLGLQPNAKPLSPIDEEQLMFTNIQGILVEPRVPARMLSGLYRLLATLPGASVVGMVTDTLGRRVLEVTYRYPEAPGADMHLELALLFDPKTYVLLDTRSIATGKYPSYSDMAYVRSGVVDRIGALPGASSTDEWGSAG